MVINNLWPCRLGGRSIAPRANNRSAGVADHAGPAAGGPRQGGVLVAAGGSIGDPPAVAAAFVLRTGPGYQPGVHPHLIAPLTKHDASRPVGWRRSAPGRTTAAAPIPRCWWTGSPAPAGGQVREPPLESRSRQHCLPRSCGCLPIICGPLTAISNSARTTSRRLDLPLHSLESGRPWPPP